MAALVLAGAFRLIGISDRPVHTDEAVNAFQIGEILSGKPFLYRSTDFHGPLYFALSALVAKAAGCAALAQMDERILRLPAVASSLLGILLLFGIAKRTGTAAAVFAAFIWTLEPLSVYYGRYAIHESLFVCLSLGFLWALWGALENQEKRLPWGLCTGLFAGLLLATKETFAITLAAAATALLAVPALRKGLTLRFLALCAGAALVVAIPCFTWGFRNPNALLDLVAAAKDYLSRASGQGHEKPWFYYFTIIGHLRSALVLYLLAGTGAWLAWQRQEARFLLFYTAALFAAYSLIPYKTPWLLLNMVLPAALLAGLGLAALPWRVLQARAEPRPPNAAMRQRAPAALQAVRLGVALGLLVFTVCALLDIRHYVFLRASDERNPLAYSHTVEDIKGLPLLAHGWQQRNGRAPRIAVAAQDPWPLPWYLRQIPSVGYWTKPGELPPADLLILDTDSAEALAPEKNGWRPFIFGQRPGALLLLYQRNEQP